MVKNIKNGELLRSLKKQFNISKQLNWKKEKNHDTRY